MVKRQHNNNRRLWIASSVNVRGEYKHFCTLAVTGRDQLGPLTVLSSIYFEKQSSQTIKVVIQSGLFSAKNALKLTYEYL